MSIVYKLTDQNMCTYNNTQWELNKPKHTSGKGDLCSSGWLHCYSNKLLAILLNPIHSNFKNPRLFEAIATGNHKFDKGLKEGSTTLVLVKEISLPIITQTQIIAFGILASLEVYKEKSFQKWATNWLNNKDRTAAAAYAAAYAYAANADAHAYAAYAAAYADADAYAAYADADAYAAYAAAHAAAAHADSYTAIAVAYATNADLDLKKIAIEALKY